MRDGAILYADIFRPKGAGKFRHIVNISCYQKDKVWVPPADLEEKANPYMTLGDGESAVVGAARLRVRARGYARLGQVAGPVRPGRLAGDARFLRRDRMVGETAMVQRQDRHAGISYHATTQWRVAGLQPPSLKAIIPWEGYGDAYRDAVFHGGIFQLYYLATWYATQMAHHLLGDPQEYNPDAFRNERLCNYMRHSLDTGYWDNRSAQWDKIKVPLFSAGNWSGHNLHLRGNTEGFMQRRVEAQEAAHPHRHALPRLLHRGRPPRPVALVRLLAERHRHRDHGRAAGEAHDPHRRRHHERLQVPLRERVAAQAHAMDEILSARRAQGAVGRPDGRRGRAAERRRRRKRPRSPIRPPAPRTPAWPRPLRRCCRPAACTAPASRSKPNR